MTRRRRKKSTSNGARPGLWRRARSWMGSVTAILLVVGLSTLVWSTLQTQKLVGLRQLAAELEIEQAEAQARLKAVNARLSEARNYDRIVERARLELGMIDSDASSRTFVAMPAREAVDDGGFVGRLADRLDRFSQVRASLAAEESP